MLEVVAETKLIARRCEAAAKLFDDEAVASMIHSLLAAANAVGKASSESGLGYQANVYIENFRPKTPHDVFSHEWGFSGRHSQTRGGPWVEYDDATVQEEIKKRAGVRDMDLITDTVKVIKAEFDKCQRELLATIDALLANTEDTALWTLRGKVGQLESHDTTRQLFKAMIAGKQYLSRDSRALEGGPKAQPHLAFLCWIVSHKSYQTHVLELAQHSSYLADYLEKKFKLKGNFMPSKGNKIFIGHGGDPVWKELKDFLHERLKLEWVEFNCESPAGKSTKERLQEMLDESCFAFIVMTAEDDGPDQTKRARANVIHEAGLFQGRLGFERAIVMLEGGCEEFSNIAGLTQLRFEKRNFKALFEDVRRVLEREGLIRPSHVHQG